MHREQTFRGKYRDVMETFFRGIVRTPLQIDPIGSARSPIKVGAVSRLNGVRA